MNYSNKIWLASEEGYFETLKTKLEVNVLDDAAYQEFVEAVKPVWQYYVDQGDFTWDDINRAQKIAQ